MGRMSLKYDGNESSKSYTRYRNYKKDIANISRIAISVESEKLYEKNSEREVCPHEELGAK